MKTWSETAYKGDGDFFQKTDMYKWKIVVNLMYI